MKKQRDFLLWGILLLVIFAGCWYFISSFYRQQIVSQQTDFLKERGQLFLKLADDQEELQDFAKKYISEGNNRITLLDEKGTIIFDTSDEKLHGERSDRPEVQAVLKGSSLGQSLRQSTTLKQELLYVALPIKNAGQLSGILRIAEPTAPFFEKSQTIKRAILLVYLLFCLFITLLIFYSLRQKNRPVQTILPVLKKMIASPTQQEFIMQDTPQHAELYQAINQLSEQMSYTYQAFAASERQLHTLLNELSIGIFIVDRNYQLRLINPTMQEQLQIGLSPKLPQSFSEVITEPQLIQLVYQITDKTPFLHEEIIIAGEPNRVLDLNLRLFNNDQEILGISYDLTRVRQLEKMQKDFVGNVSHELKTPVTSLIGFTETLLDGAKEDPETLTQFLRIIQKDAYRLEALIQEIIQLSKGTAALNYASQKISVASLLQQIIADYQPLLTEKRIAVKMTGPAEYQFYSKLELLQPILKNLIENAVNYSSLDSEILIDYHEKNGLHLSVSDQGIGIDSDDQQRIFERFYRVDKARSRYSGGTGLGLAIVKDYTQLLGGTIQVDSHPGVGSTFTIHLPQFPY